MNFPSARARRNFIRFAVKYNMNREKITAERIIPTPPVDSPHYKPHVCPVFGSPEYMKILGIETIDQLYRHDMAARAHGYGD